MSSPKPVLVVSDLHLGAVPPATEKAFRAFLRFAATESSGLLINGDLFDVWLATRHFVVSHHVRVMAAIAEIVDAGVPVWFVGGNHDSLELGGSFLRDELGVQLLNEPAQLQLGGYRALVIHGDGVRAGDHGYQKRHPYLRSRAMRRVVESVMHVDRIYDAIARWSGTGEFVARHQRGESTGPKPAAPLIERWARDALRANPDVDIVLAGHSHLPEWLEIESDRYYMNTGDWISHMTYGVLGDRGQQPELCRWPDRSRVAGDNGKAIQRDRRVDLRPIERLEHPA